MQAFLQHFGGGCSAAKWVFWPHLGLLLGLLLAGCTDPYEPSAISTTRRYLVIDGFINTNGVTQIKLSRTYSLTSNTPPPETRAVVAIEEEGGTRYPLQESPSGTYQSASQVLVSGKRYRLRITTTQGVGYLSDFTPAKLTPVIDNITWRSNPTGIVLYLNSQDATGNTQYYRWDYDETWESRPLLSPSVEYVNEQIRRLATPYPRVCWINEKSSTISLAKTTNLNQDVVADFPLRTFPLNSSRFYTLYSVLVRQYAQSPEEYAYWEQLKKNTESIGTLFDPLPSQLTGNVRCLTDENELALGFVGAHSVTEKRIFINRSELPIARYLSGYEGCFPPDTLRASFSTSLDDILRGAFSSSGGKVPIDEVTDGVTASTRECVDCRLRGMAVKPSYWP